MLVVLSVGQAIQTGRLLTGGAAGFPEPFASSFAPIWPEHTLDSR